MNSYSRGRLTKVIIALVLLIPACGGDEWPEAQQEAFIENCERTSGGETNYCECALEEAQEAESDPNNLTAGQMANAAEECSDEL